VADRFLAIDPWRQLDMRPFTTQSDGLAAALDELPDDDLPAAREAARRWHGKNAAALARHLARKGFSRRAIFAVLKEHPGLSAEGADPDLP